MNSLTQLMRDHCPSGGVLLPQRVAHMEIIEQSSNQVWMSVAGVTAEQFEQFELAEGWRKVGRASGAVDQAMFYHSPGAEQQPVRQREINGLRFINVAQPAQMSQHSCGLPQISVNKAHALGFEAGRTLSILNCNGESFVEVVGSAQHDAELPLADGASIQQLTLAQAWLLELPNPTTTLWSFEPAMRSFQGPVELPDFIEHR